MASPDGTAAASPFAVQVVTTDSLGALAARRAVNSSSPWWGRAGDALQSLAVENLTALSPLDWVPAKHLNGTDSACTQDCGDLRACAKPSALPLRRDVGAEGLTQALQWSFPHQSPNRLNQRWK